MRDIRFDIGSRFIPCLRQIPASSVQVNFERDDRVTAFFEAASTAVDLTVVPNPVGDHCYVQFMLDEITPIALSLLDLHGRTIFHQSYGRMGGGLQRVELTVGDLPEGLYFVELKTEQKTYVEKLIK